MAKASGIVVVDTYAIMADLLGQATPPAVNVLESIRVGDTRGILHYLIIYELTYHWRKGRLPFHDENELLEFIGTYFDVINLNPKIAVEAAQIKVKGDQMLKQSSEKILKRRKLSVSDATSIALAKALKAPIVTGDADLMYVARKMDVQILW